MNCPLLLWLFWPIVMSTTVSENSVNVTLGPTTELSRGEQASSTSIPVDVAMEVRNDCDKDEDSGTPKEEVRISLKNHRDNMTEVRKKSFFGPENDATKMRLIYCNLTLPEGVDQLLVTNITCISSMSMQLSCNWTTVNSPACAHYSATISQADEKATSCHCDKISKNLVGCHADFKPKKKDIQFHINASCTNFWYNHFVIFDPKEIEKLDPPQNVTASVTSGNLVITWKPPNGVKPKCLLNQIRINNELKNISVALEYNMPDVDLTRSYFVQMRVTKSSVCRENHIWSDWSDILEVTPKSPSKMPYELKPLVIATIVLGIPMFLLAVLLLCRCHRMFEKLFPVPSPSTKIKCLLEKDDFIKVVPSKYVEEITELQFVGADEHVKSS
ncbi:hypothetical protein MATL_G00149570 [Megalops atlanticus]|uniref:Uncharacterized protein n=1 Tax=Megalops atlanticus TaxID=7932 RepID=A0A9D3T8N7_MEGAT|nr:hypothetical protein MATL_G00149570 [Megalops atlanticus]